MKPRIASDVPDTNDGSISTFVLLIRKISKQTRSNGLTDFEKSAEFARCSKPKWQ
jgi:hypothetical protein